MTKAALALILLASTGCTYSMDWIRQFRAQRAIAKQDYASALPLLQEITESHAENPRGLEAARTGARTAHLSAKNYPLAVKFYRFIVMKSDSAQERKNAQKAIAQIYYENLQDLDRAVIEYEKLLKLENSPEEAFRFRLSLAKSSSV